MTMNEFMNGNVRKSTAESFFLGNQLYRATAVLCTMNIVTGCARRSTARNAIRRRVFWFAIDVPCTKDFVIGNVRSLIAENRLLSSTLWFSTGWLLTKGAVIGLAPKSGVRSLSATKVLSSNIEGVCTKAFV